MPRSKLPLDEVRNIDVCTAFNKKEFARIEHFAKCTKKRPAEYLREKGLNIESLKIVPDLNAQAAQQIREILNILTQIALFVEQDQMPVLDPIFFLEMQKDLKQMHLDFLRLTKRQNLHYDIDENSEVPNFFAVDFL